MRILTVSPLPLSHDSWERDIVVLARGFEAMGHQAACVRLPSKDGTDFPIVLQVPWESMASAEWWRAQAPELVVANTWGDPRGTPLVKAIKACGAKLLIRLDSAGYNSPLGHWGEYVRVAFVGERDAGKSVVASAAKAVAKALVFSVPWVRDRRVIEQLELADRVTIESSKARELFAASLRWLGRGDLAAKIGVVPHPIAPREGEEIPAAEKRRGIACAGRWDSYFKDAPLMAQVLADALVAHPEWEAVVAGRKPEPFERARAALPEAAATRMHILGLRSHGEVQRMWAEAKICLFTSRMESGPLAAQEALCTGCTVVGPAVIPSMHTLATGEFGSQARQRTRAGFAQALGAEIANWENGTRDPVRIAALARARYDHRAVCSALLREIGGAIPQ